MGRPASVWIPSGIDECDELLRLNEHDHVARFWRAKLLARAKDGVSAGEDLKTAIDADPELFTRAVRDRDLGNDCPETKAVLDRFARHAEIWVRPTLEMLVVARDRWQVPAELDAALVDATERIVTADACELFPAVQLANRLFRHVRRLSNTYRQVAEFRASTQQLSAIAFSPDGWTLATADGGPAVKLWGCDHWNELRQFAVSPSALGLTFAPDGKFLATCGLTVRLWDTRTARQEHECETEWEIESFAERVAFVRGGRWLVWKGSDSGECGGWDLGTREPLPDEAVGEHWRDVDGVTAHSGDRRLWATARNQELRVCELPAGVELWRFENHPFSIDGLAASPNGHVATGCPDGVIRVWQASSGARVSEITVAPADARRDDEALPVSLAAPTCLAFSSEGLLAAGCADGMVRVWRYGFVRRDRTLTEAERDERVETLMLRRAERQRYEKLKSVLSRRTGEGSSSA